MLLRRTVGFAAAVLAQLAGGVSAQVTVFTGAASQAAACSAAAKQGSVDPRSIHACTIAIEHEALLGRDLAGTYVNRGVLYLRSGAWSDARRDFDLALSIEPGMGEALINRGAVRIAQRQWAAGVADIDLGLAHNPEEPEKAYYNRALAKEHLDDTKGAYLDYMKAAELAPTWTAPQVELKRFTVRSREGA